MTRTPMTRAWRVAFGVAAVAVAIGLAPTAFAADTLKIMAPAAPGGGWDGTARNMQQALQSTGIVKTVQVANVPGAGGTIGLAQLISSHKGDGTQVMMTGMVMVGAILTNKSPVTLAQTTPIARLTGEYQGIVVTTDSPIKSMADLVALLKKDPGAVSWGGGSAGGTDHILVGLIAQHAGVDPAKVNYVAHAGGGEAMASILGKHVTAGVNSWSELVPQIQAGKLRALGISSEKRLAGVDAPTLIEQGINVELANWRAVVAPPGITDAQKKDLVDTIDKMVKSPAWKDVLAKQNWIDAYQSGDTFAKYLTDEQARIEKILRGIGLVK